MPSRREITGIFAQPPGSGIWWADYYDAEGRRHRKKCGSKKAAIAYYVRRKAEALEGRFPPAKPAEPESITFAELAKDAMAYRKARVAPFTYSSDSWRLRILNEHLGSELIDKITVMQLAKVLQQLEDGRSGSTLNRYRALLSAIFTYGTKMKRIAVNLMQDVDPYEENEGRERYVDAGEEDAIRAAIRKIHPEGEAEFDLALHTGMRRGEQWNLKWKDVNLERSVLIVRGIEVGAKKTGRREVALNSTAVEALRELHARSAGSAYVIPDAENGIRDWRRWFEEDCVPASGVEDIQWHDLRHTFTSRLVMEGADLVSVQRLLGHKSITTTMKYAHLAPNHMREQVEKLVRKTKVTGKDTEAVVPIVKKKEVL